MNAGFASKKTKFLGYYHGMVLGHLTKMHLSSHTFLTVSSWLM